MYTMMKGLVLAVLFAICGVSAKVFPAEVVVEFDNPDQSTLYHALLKEYRCLKCQNQNLSDSNASLAGDLRREIQEQILSGKDKQAIDNYLVARYGEFVLYRPRFNAKTAILWIGPFALLLIALTCVVMMVRNHRVQRISQVNKEDPAGVSGRDLIETDRLEKARKLLSE